MDLLINSTNNFLKSFNSFFSWNIICFLFNIYLPKNKSKTSKCCPWNFFFSPNPGHFNSKRCLNEANLSPMPIQAMFCFCMNIYKIFLPLHYILHFVFFYNFLHIEKFCLESLFCDILFWFKSALWYRHAVLNNFSEWFWNFFSFLF